MPRFASLLQPLDEERKAGLPNCTICRGCNVELLDMSETAVRFQNVRFHHGKGATNSHLFFAQVPGISKRFIVKVRELVAGPHSLGLQHGWVVISLLVCVGLLHTLLQDEAWDRQGQHLVQCEAGQ